MFSGIRLISFDLDDTLWPCRPVIMRAEQALYNWLLEQAPGLTAQHSLESMREHRTRFAEANPALAHDLTELRRQALRQLLSEYGYDVALAEAAVALFREARNQVEPYDDVLPALAALRAEYVLVSVTNGNAQVEYTSLRDSFDFSITAAEVGAAKPDPAVFKAAGARTGIALPDMLHVGDDPERDVMAARDAGLKTVWLSRSKAAWPQSLPRPDISVNELFSLQSYLLKGACMD